MRYNERLGYADGEWQLVKTQLKSILVETARKEQLITYKDLSAGLGPERFPPNSEVLSALLYEVTREEFLNGKGLLTSVVVKSGQVPFPGDGFFKCAEGCGKKIYGRQKFWIRELRHLYSLHREYSKDAGKDKSYERV